MKALNTKDLRNMFVDVEDYPEDEFRSPCYQVSIREEAVDFLIDKELLYTHSIVGSKPGIQELRQLIHVLKNNVDNLQSAAKEILG